MLFRSRALKLAAVAWLVGGVGCSERDLGDEPMEELFEHPPEWLERHQEACEEKCAVVDECLDREPSICSCLDFDFSTQPTLCLEKRTLLWECRSTLTCEELDFDNVLPQEDQPCHGQGVAEAVAC